MSGSQQPENVILQSKAAVLLDAGQPAEAIQAAEEEMISVRAALEAEPAKWTPLLVHLLETQAQGHSQLGDFERARQLTEEAIGAAESEGNDPDSLARLRTSLCSILDQAGRDSGDLVPYYEQAIAALEGLETPDAITAARLRNNLAMAFKRLNKLALAEQNYLRSLEALEGALGKETEEVASLYNNLGSLYYTAGFSDQAGEMFNEALDIRMRLCGADHPDVAQSLTNLGTVNYELGKNEEAMNCYERALTILEANLAEKAQNYEATGNDYVSLLNAIGEDKKASALQKRMEKVLAS